MDMLDPGLDTANAAANAASSHEKGQESEEGVELQEGDGTNADEQTAVAIASVQQGAFSDHNIQYQFRTENNGGQVTYRVVQVTDSQLDGQTDATGAVSVVSTAAFTSGQQAVAQAVIQNPFSNGGSPAADTVSGEARFAYFPASTVGDATAVSVQTTDQSLTQAGVNEGLSWTQNGPGIPPEHGQFYVMMTPQDVLQTGTQRTIAPRTHPYSPYVWLQEYSEDNTHLTWNHRVVRDPKNYPFQLHAMEEHTFKAFPTDGHPALVYKPLEKKIPPHFQGSIFHHQIALTIKNFPLMFQ
nr:PREDICTED: upstream stimulatory factor 2 isoform X2 [Anolis carolinensis]|eukprot:XP_008115503.1 PREDICTED: upstream stimulatory factor 2 isoform X2 [Anolis carolinensis]